MQHVVLLLILPYILINIIGGHPVHLTGEDIGKYSQQSSAGSKAPSRTYLLPSQSQVMPQILTSESHVQDHSSASHIPLLLHGAPTNLPWPNSYNHLPTSHSSDIYIVDSRGKAVVPLSSHAQALPRWRHLASLNKNQNPSVLNKFARSGMVQQARIEKAVMQPDTRGDEDMSRYHAALLACNLGQNQEQVAAPLADERQEYEKQTARKNDFNEAWNRQGLSLNDPPHILAEKVFTMKVESLGDRTIRMFASNKVQMKGDEPYELQYLSRIKDLRIQFQEMKNKLRADGGLNKLNSTIALETAKKQVIKKADELQEKRKRLAFYSPLVRLSENPELDAVGRLVRNHLQNKRKCFFNISLRELEKETRVLEIEGMSKTRFTRNFHEFLNRARIISADELTAFKRNRKIYIDLKRREDEKEKVKKLLQAQQVENNSPQM